MTRCQFFIIDLYGFTQFRRIPSPKATSHRSRPAPSGIVVERLLISRTGILGDEHMKVARSVPGRGRHTALVVSRQHQRVHARACSCSASRYGQGAETSLETIDRAPAKAGADEIAPCVPSTHRSWSGPALLGAHLCFRPGEPHEHLHRRPCPSINLRRLRQPMPRGPGIHAPRAISPSGRQNPPESITAMPYGGDPVGIHAKKL